MVSARTKSWIEELDGSMSVACRDCRSGGSSYRMKRERGFVSGGKRKWQGQQASDYYAMSGLEND